MKLRNLFLAAGVALVSMGATAQTNVEDIRIYINPGHGSWGPNNRHMPTLGGHETISSTDPDTTDFYESNTNLKKCLTLFHRLKQYGFKHEDGKKGNDLTQNIVMSHIECGPYPYSTTAPDGSTQNPDRYNAYNRTLSEIAAEVEANNFDMFISVHSNASSEGNTTNYLYFAFDDDYTGNDREQSIYMSIAGWNYAIANPHTQWTSYNYEISNSDYAAVAAGSKAKIGYQGLGVLNHSVSGYLVEGYFHTYQPARHKYMNPDVCNIEGLAYARGVADYYGIAKETTGDIYGVVRDANQKFANDSLFIPRGGTPDVYMHLMGVEVFLKQGEDTIAKYITDNNYNGSFVFRDLNPGEYTIEFSHPDYKADTTYTWNVDRVTKDPAPIKVTVEAAKTAFPLAFLESKTYVAPTVVYVNYPDSTAGKAGYELAKYYEVKGTAKDLLAEQLENKVVRRQIVREDKLYVLALDTVANANEPYIYLADLAAGTVDTLDMTAVVVAPNGKLKISDIALTADHYLVASSMSVCHISDEQATTNGEERGAVNIYKWTKDETTKLPATCELWFSTQTSCNYYYGVMARSIAYSGTIEDGELTITGEHGSKTSSIAMRMERLLISDGQKTGEERLDTWASGYNETINKYFYADNLSTSQDYELMISPLEHSIGQDDSGADIYTEGLVIDGNKTTPIEFYFAKTGAKNPATIELNETFVNAKAVGANYFKYAGRSLMVAPDVNADGKVQGVKLFDITDGFANAVEVTLDGATIDPVEYTYASAHGELALTISADDRTTDAEIELFLVVDGKATKFSVGDFYTTASITRGTINGTANPFAYALKSEIADNTLKISYSLNADATDVNINVKDAEGNVVATSAEGAKAKGAYTAEISIADFEDGDYTWEISVEGAAKDAIERFSSVSFYHPSGLDVDNSFESGSFGTLFIAEGYTQGKTSGYVSAQADGSEGGGLYIYNAAGEQVLNKDGKARFYPEGITCTGRALGTNTVGADLCRVAIAEDGRIFVNRYNYEGDYYLYAESLEQLVADGKFTSLVAGMTLTDGVYNDANGNYLAGPAQGFDVVGSGEDLKLIALSRTSTAQDAVFSQNRVVEYNLGTASVLPTPTAFAALDQKYTISYDRSANLQYDNQGGVWYVQYRGTPSNEQPALIYVDADGTIQYFEGAGGAVRRRGALSVSPDGTHLVAASAQGVLSVYKIVRDETGKVTLNEQHRLTHNMGNNLYDLAWGSAGNFYGSNASGELVDGYALPQTEAFTTKAAAKYGFTVGTSSVIDIEVNEEVPAVYYNLQGVKVENPANGIYIVKRSNKVTKEYIK